MTNQPGSSVTSQRFFCCQKAFAFNPGTAGVVGVANRDTIEGFLNWLRDDPNPRLRTPSDLWYGLADTRYILRIDKVDKESGQGIWQRWYIASRPRWPPADYLGLEKTTYLNGHPRLNGSAHPLAAAPDTAQLAPGPSSALPAQTPAQLPPLQIEFDYINPRQVSTDQNLQEQFEMWHQLSPVPGYRCTAHNTIYHMFGKPRRKMSSQELEAVRRDVGHGIDVKMGNGRVGG